MFKETTVKYYKLDAEEEIIVVEKRLYFCGVLVYHSIGEWPNE